MADEISVKFGAETDALTQGVNNAMRPIADFSDRVKDLNAQLTALDNPVKNVGVASAAAAGETDKLSFATAGATREFIVLGHEVMTGNFSRIPGSLLVLGERTGGLSTLLQNVTLSTVGWAAAIGAVIAASYEWISANAQIAATQETVRGAMELNNQAQSYNADTTEINITRLRLLADVNQETAEKISIAFARTGSLSADLKEKLLLMVGDYAAATGKDAPKAAEDLIKMFANPKKGAEELAATMTGVLSPAQLEQIQLAARNGDTLTAQSELYAALGSKIDDFRLNHLIPLQRNLESVRDLWVEMFNKTPDDVPGQSRADHWKAPIGVPDKQKAASEEEEHQNEINRLIKDGNQVEQQSGLLIARKNALLERQAELMKAANAADSQGDTGTADRFRSDAAEIQQQMDALKGKGQRAADAEAKKAHQDEMQMAREGVTYDEQMGRLKLANEKTVLDEKVAMGEISKKEEYEQLQKLTDDEYALEQKALADASQVDGLTVVEQQKIDDQMLLLHQKYLNQKDALTRKSLLDEKQQYDQVFQGINRAFTQSINGILQGTQTWQQATANIFTGILSVFVDMAEKMVAKWLEAQVMQAIFGKEEAAGQIATDAAQAGAGAYAATAAIPYVGPALAPAAAANAYAQTMAFQGLASFDVGSWELPSDQVARVHQGEMIVPKPFADSMRENGGLGGGDTYHISAVDAQSFVNMLKNNSAAITAIVGKGVRNFSTNLKPA